VVTREGAEEEEADVVKRDAPIDDLLGVPVSWAVNFLSSCKGGGFTRACAGRTTAGKR